MDPRLAYARELEQRDGELAARIEGVLALGKSAGEIRSRAATLEAELAALPGRRAQVEEAAVDAEDAVAAAREALAEAKRAPGGDEERALRRAQAVTEVRAAEERHARLIGRLAALGDDEARLGREAGALGGAAAELAAELEREPRVASAAPDAADLGALQRWAARAYAAVFVARGGLESERDRIVREANELASVVLGEALQATSAASARDRLERVLA